MERFMGLTLLLIPSIWATIIVGWVMNIIDVINLDWNGPFDIQTVLHLVGILFVPLGVVMGIFF